MSKVEAMIRAAALKALKGDAKSLQMLVALQEKIRNEQKTEIKPVRCQIARSGYKYRGMARAVPGAARNVVGICAARSPAT